MIDDAEIIEGILAENQELKAEIKQLRNQIENIKHPPTDWLSILIQTSIIFSVGFGIGAVLTNDTAYQKGLRFGGTYYREKYCLIKYPKDSESYSYCILGE
ncbi:MAG TPA: hypothetical protein VK203_22675 [Nostocaceae cyanobacterium]|nr:hypothetical protein [Nostocaceae cyanobacterium]